MPRDRCESSVISYDNKIDKKAAIDAAVASPEYVGNTKGYQKVSYYSMFEIDHVDGSCSVSVHTVNVVFAMYNSAFEGYIVVTENPTGLSPISSIIQKDQPRYNSCATSPCYNTVWAGYEVYGNAGATATEYFAYSQFNVAQVSYPPTGCFNGNPCIMSTWTGVEDQQGAYPDGNLAQDGITGYCLGQNCAGQYWGWYELLPAAPVNCVGFTVNGGDSMVSETYNDAAVHGSNQQYGFYLHDITTNLSCGSDHNNYGQMTNPTYSDFIVENPRACGSAGCSSLPRFGQVSFDQAQNQEGYINTDVGRGWDYQDFMQNCGVTNVFVGGVSGNGDFAATWQSSYGTPVYSTGC